MGANVNANDYILAKYKPEIGRHMPIRIHETRHGGLTRLWAELGYQSGAEIGVEQGHYSEEILCGNSGARLYCIDPWQTYTRYFDHVSQSKLDRFYAEAVERLKPYAERCTIIKAHSVDAARNFKDGELDFAYIDGNHEYQYVVNDICEWMRVVRPGGMLAGHDYRRDKSNRIPFHVIQAVQGYADAYHITPWFVILGDRAASWLWIKP